jgi:phosphoribosylanthranilate isomerase
MKITICGITHVDQAIAIANLGVDYLGLICVEASPRYVAVPSMRDIIAAVGALKTPPLNVGVFANASLDTILTTVSQTNLDIIQLHGEESPVFCQQLRQQLSLGSRVGPPGGSKQLWKVLRVRSAADLATGSRYEDYVDGFLLDAYHPRLGGGTGQVLDWQLLGQFRPALPWFLAGGLKPENVQLALDTIQPTGIDVSSGVERSPGDKDLERVAALIAQVRATAVR